MRVRSMGTISINSLAAMKARGEKFACLTAYDATFASLISAAGVEVLLVGDSLGMVLQGHPSTLPVSMDDMCYHTQCVARGNQGALLMADMPFMANASIEETLKNAGRLMQAGAQMVKLEGSGWLNDSVRALSAHGIPVCAHLGLTPQSVYKFGGYKVQGRDSESANAMLNAAQDLVEAGADLLLLECVPSTLAAEITAAVPVPVIGIGAGGATDGQILVMHDLLGVSQGRTPRFVKNFMQEADSISGAVAAYAAAVKEQRFPAVEHGFVE